MRTSTGQSCARFMAVVALSCVGFVLAAANAATGGIPISRKISLPNAVVGVPYNVNTASGWFCSTNASPTFTFQWQNANAVPGLVISTSGLIGGVPTTPGAYTLGFSVRDSSGLPGACGGSVSDSYTLVVAPAQAPDPLPDATAGQPYNVNVALRWGCGSNASPVFSFQWHDPTAVPGLSFASSGIIAGTPTKPGTYTFTVTVTDVSGRPGACSGQTIQTYSIVVRRAPPSCTISQSPPGQLNAGAEVALTANCSNDPTAYSWIANGVSVGSGSTIFASPAETTLYIVTAVNGAGSAQQSVIVSVKPPAPACRVMQEPPGAVYAGVQVRLIAVCDIVPNSYAWTANGLPIGVASNIAVAPTQTTTYFVTATGSGGNSVPAQATVAVQPAFPSDCTIAASPAALPPGGGTVQLSASCSGGGTPSATGYAWSGPGLAAQNGAVVTTSIPITTTFSVTASNGGGTSPPAEVTVSVGVAPPSNCAIAASPATLPAGGGTVALTMTCSGGGAPSPTGFVWSGLGDEYPSGGGGAGQGAPLRASLPRGLSRKAAACGGACLNSPTGATVTTHLVRTSTVTATASNAGGASSPAILQIVVPVGPPANYQGLWWNSPPGSEPVWGINFAHQGDIIFATWYTYDADGEPLWLVVSASKSGPDVYSGTLYRTKGSAWEQRFDASESQGTPVGNATFTFTGNDNAEFAYTVDGVAGKKSITRQQFASPVPACTWGAQPNLAAATNYTDLWWADPPNSEPGWGINLNHQGSTIFAAWFTYAYDGIGKPFWMVVAATKIAPKIYRGKVFSAKGPAYTLPTMSAAQMQPIELGTATFTFDDGNSGTLEYTLLGMVGRKRITRQNFGAPGMATVCTPTEAITTCEWNVRSGFTGDPNATYDYGSGSAGGGSAGGGSAGAGPGEGKMIGALIEVNRVSDGASLGTAYTAQDGMVTIDWCEADLPVVLTVHGGPGVLYYDEGTKQYGNVASGLELHALVEQFNENIGITAGSESAYRHAQNHVDVGGSLSAVEGDATRKAAGSQTGLTLRGIRESNRIVRDEINRLLPDDSKLASITSLPTPIDNTSPVNAYPKNRYGIAAAVTGGFAKAAAAYLPDSSSPALAWTEQLARDLTDGQLNGFALNATPAASGSNLAFDPVRLPVALSAGMYAVSNRFGVGSTLQLGPGLSDYKTFAVTSFGECIVLFDEVALLSDGSVNVRRTTPVAGKTCYVAGDATSQTLLRGFATDVKHIFTTSTNGYVVKSDGTLWAWGDARCGLLGNGTTAGMTVVPVPVSGVTDVTSLAGVGRAAVIARDARGNVYSWGSDEFGALGTNGVAEGYGCSSAQTGSNLTAHRIPPLANIVTVAGSASGRALAIDDRGYLYGWGQLVSGQRFGTPISVVAFASIVSVTTDAANTTFALRANGSVLRVKFPNAAEPIANVADIVQIAGGFALRRDGTVIEIGNVGQWSHPPNLSSVRHVEPRPDTTNLTINAFGVNNDLMAITGSRAGSGGCAGLCVSGTITLPDPGSVQSISTTGLR